MSDTLFQLKSIWLILKFASFLLWFAGYKYIFVFELFFQGLDNLFPENKSTQKSDKFEKDNEKEKIREVSNKGIDQYFMSFPGLKDDEDSKQSQSQFDSSWE